MNRTFAYVLVYCVAFVIAGCERESSSQLVSSARDHLEKSDPKSAVVILRNALQNHPDDAATRYLLGRALIAAEDFGSAEKELRRALELGYPAAEVNPLLAEALVNSGENKQVIEHFANATISAQGAAQLKTAVGNAHFAVGNLDQAGEQFKQALAADPSYAPALIGQAKLKAKLGDLPGALADSQAAAGIAPESLDATLLMGDVLVAQGQGDTAVGAYRKSLELDPNGVRGQAGVVRALLVKDDIQGALANVSKMKETLPRAPETYYMEALVLVQSKDYLGAERAVQKQLQIAPNDVQGQLLAAGIEYELRSYSQAESRLLLFLRQHPENRYARLLLIETYLRAHRPASALQVLPRLLEESGNDTQVLGVAGSVYLQNGDAANAAKYFNQAVKQNPKNVVGRTGLAVARVIGGDQRGFGELRTIAENDDGTYADFALISTCLERRQWDQALAAIDVLERKQQHNPLPHNLRGLALEGKNDIAGARRSYEQALAIQPSFFPATVNLGRLDYAANDKAGATRRFEALLARDPKNSDAWLALAALRARDGGSPEDVGNTLSKAIAANEAAVQPRLALIAHYLRSNEPKRALAAAEEAATALPRDPEVLEALARAQVAAGETNQALATYVRLGEMMPESTGPQLAAATLQVRLKDYDGAAQALRTVVRLQPELVSARRDLAFVYLRNNQSRDAMHIAQALEKEHPADPAGYLVEGDVYAARKEWAEALKAYRLGLGKSGSWECAARIHSVLLASGQMAEADKVASAWMSQHPNDVAYQKYLAESATRRGDFAAAMKYYDTLLRKQPGNPVLLNNLAWAAGKLNDPRALEYATKANELAPNQPPIMDTLGVLLVGKGDARGIAMLRDAVRLAPNEPDIRFDLAESLAKIGDKQAARKELDEIAKLGAHYSRQDEVEKLRASL